MTSRPAHRTYFETSSINHWITCALVASCVVTLPACRSSARPPTLASIRAPALPAQYSAAQKDSASQRTAQTNQQASSTTESTTDSQTQLHSETSLVSASEVLLDAEYAALPTMDAAALPVSDVAQAADLQIVDSQATVLQNSVPINAPVAVSTTQVSIDGVRAGRGIVHIAYFTDSQGFPDAKYAARTESLVSEREGLTAEVREAGKVAIAVYQDVNGDGTLNVNRFGIPIEPFAFSNNAMGKRGPPSFDEAAIKVGAAADPSKAIRIQLP